MIPHRVAFAIPTMLAVWLSATLSAADWPMPRHDAKRTGATRATSNIVGPAPYWRHFVGGAISARGALAGDVDGDGIREIVFLSGGRVVAKRAATADIVDQSVWQTRSLEALQIVGIADLDGDGMAELVVRSSRQVFVLRQADGEILWTEPAEEMGTIGGVRVADLDGDGIEDLFIQECGCCALNSLHTGFAYRFAAPGASIGAPALLWTLPSVMCGGYLSMAVAHMLPGAGAQVVLGSEDNLSLLDGATATLLASTPTIGTRTQWSRCLPIDVEGDGAEELVCVLNDDAAPADGIGRRAFLVRYVPTPSPSLAVEWQQLVGDLPGAVTIPANPVADLDGNGTLELVLSGKDTSGQSETLIYDATLGTQLGLLYGQEVAAVAPVRAGGRALLLTRVEHDLFAWSYDAAPAPHTTLLWSLPGRQVAIETDLGLARSTYLDQRPVTIDLDGDGVLDLVTVDAATRDDFLVHRCTGDLPEAIAHYQVPDDASLLQLWDFPALQGQGTLLAVAQTDGNLHALDSSLLPLGGSPEHGVRFGGYYSQGSFRQLQLEPVVASLQDSPAQAVLASTSRGAVVRLDAQSASLANGPKVLWSRDNTLNAVVVAGLDDGKPAVVAVDNEQKDGHRVVALRADGSERWRAGLPGITLADLVPASIAGDGTADLYVQWGAANDAVEHVRALSGIDGHTLSDGPPFGPGDGNRQPAGAAAADWDGDGLDDLVFQTQPGSTYVLSGASGILLTWSPPSTTYRMPTLYDADGDGQDEVFLHASFAPLGALDHDLANVLWWSSDDDRPYPYAAVAECPGVPGTLVSGSWRSPARLKLTVMAGPDAGSSETVVLAGGQLYPDEQAAEQSGASLGQLSSPVVHANLAGDGQAAALVGSSDGWLYGLDPCARTLRFAVDFDSPVGSVVFGDTDGDGLDEILVSVADGYLYGLKQARVGTPAWVIDTDPPNGVLAEDVDEIRTTDTLYAAWAAVDDADSYAIAVVRDEFAGGGYVTDPPWLPVGNVTSTSIPYLGLEDGVRYFAAVRALKGGDVSPDALSDGVVVRLEGTGQAGAGARAEPVWLTGRSCVYFCAVAPAGRAAPAWALLTGLGAGLGLRRARRPRRL